VLACSSQNLILRAAKILAASIWFMMPLDGQKQAPINQSLHFIYATYWCSLIQRQIMLPTAHKNVLFRA
jgi:hypothetical protein